ncbi:SRA stem-loop-interacting RNA-binding protein, mitochondrial [Geodia barretti]|uniref:SRA stem-loop-interacting RNA-binding protein, mitochondrial n=1 Tax=Geodia barretti TaxID=519541 RepID=A0AA35WH63_GEOBA|nr:SRA stem-loop-interacting RNA-binding protein, mitochondrial [Geodia barretti]
MAVRVPKVGVGLFVSRLHWTVSDACLRKYFEKFGAVLFSVVHIDVKTGLHKGFGWVRMSSEQEIENVLDYKRHTIEGYEADVKRDRRDEPQPNDLHMDHLSLDHVTPQTTPTNLGQTETTPTTTSHTL